MKKAIKYSIILCVISWVYAAIMIFGLGVKNPADNPMKYTIYASLYMLLPMIVAIVMQKVNKEKLASTGLLRFKIKWSWLFVRLRRLFFGIWYGFTVPKCQLYLCLKEGTNSLFFLQKSRKAVKKGSAYTVIKFVSLHTLVTGNDSTKRDPSALRGVENIHHYAVVNLRLQQLLFWP
jgi:membrane protease YdiL (CAAX protease family)